MATIIDEATEEIHEPEEATIGQHVGEIIDDTVDNFMEIKSRDGVFTAVGVGLGAAAYWAIDTFL